MGPVIVILVVATMENVVREFPTLIGLDLIGDAISLCFDGS